MFRVDEVYCRVCDVRCMECESGEVCGKCEVDCFLEGGVCYFCGNDCVEC